ncbi:MAG: hypothetical protein J6K88_06665 [Oscillospiraceae bacterium]|nr:hypothetical protein [Oscillospiraceae bacterium]
MKEKLKPIYLLSLFVLLTSILIVAVLSILQIERQLLFEIIYLCLAFFIASLIVLIAYYYMKLFYCVFSESEIKLCWWFWTYKKLPYSKIKAITIRGAVDQKFFPICDANGKQKAIISLYKSESTFRPDMLPNGISVIPSGEKELLCYTFLTSDNLKILFNKTEVSAYITEEMINLYKEYFDEIFAMYDSRIIVSCYNKFDSKTQMIPYKTWKKSLS